MNLKKEYTINTIPKTDLYFCSIAMGNSFQKIRINPKTKYIKKKHTPITRRNRSFSDFSLKLITIFSNITQPIGC